MTLASSIEQEVKLAVWPGFVLPDLDGVAEGVLAVPAAERRLEAVYYDTPDVRLARADITLRHRNDGGWTLKLPDSPVIGGALRRRELSMPGDGRAVPDEVLAHVAARVRSATIGPVARLQTLRRRTDLVDVEGKVLAEVVDDEVSVLDGRRVALRFREVEVELHDPAASELLDEVVRRLRAAGAGDPDPTPKVMRALGPPASEPPELGQRKLGSKPTAAEVLVVGLGRAARRLIEHDAGVRTSEDPEEVHQARVATRRLRSDLRTFGSLLDEEWVGPLREELKWIADALGEVRDADVLDLRLRRQLARLPRTDRVVGSGLLEVLAEERGSARERLVGALESTRYYALLDRIVEAATSPVLRPGAAQPAVDVLPQLVRGPWSTLAKAADRISARSADEELHEVRIRAKRARYAADVAATVIGKPAEKLASAIAGVQEVLGEHQDACVARDWLRQVVPDLSSPVAFVAGELAAQQTVEAAARRKEFPDAWRRASKGKLRTWLKP